MSLRDVEYRAAMYDRMFHRVAATVDMDIAIANNESPINAVSIKFFDSFTDAEKFQIGIGLAGLALIIYFKG